MVRLIRNISGSFGGWTGVNPFPSNGSGVIEQKNGLGSGYTWRANYYYGSTFSINSSKTIPISNENRCINYSINYYIRVK